MFQVFFLRFIAKKVSARLPNTESSSSYSSNSSSGNDSEGSMSDHNEDTQSHILKVYNSSLGRPTAAMHSGMTEEYDAIMKVSNYEEFFERVNLFYSPEQFTKMLRNAVRSSVLRKYTTRIHLCALGRPEMEVIDTNSSTPTRTQTENNQNTLKFTASSTPWSAVWKAYAAEKESGCYSMEKILEIRSRVMSHSRSKVIQAQQRNRNVDESGWKNNYSSSGNRAANNFNYMQRGNHHTHGNGNGGGNGPPFKQGHNMGYSTRFHPRSHGANENSASAPSLHSDGGHSTNTSYANSLNNSHTRNRPAHTKSILNRSTDVRKSNNSGNSSSGPFATYTSGSGTSQVGVGQALKNNSGNSNSSSSSNTSYVNTYSSNSNSNSNSNSYNGNYASVNTKSIVNATAVTGGNSNSNSNIGGTSNNNNNNSKSRAKVSHKNSTMNNAMSVSGDRVRLHVFYQVEGTVLYCPVLWHRIRQSLLKASGQPKIFFYLLVYISLFIIRFKFLFAQGKFVSIGGAPPAGAAAKMR
jgi:hypothetical protein